MPAPPHILHLLSRSAVQAFHIEAGRPVSLVTLWLFTGLVLGALCTRSGLRMHPLRLNLPWLPIVCSVCSFVVYAVSLTLLVAHVWHACILVVAVHGFWGFEWIVYSMLLLSPYLFAIYRPVTPTGLHATCLKYCVCSFGGPVASVRSWCRHILGTPHFRPFSILGRGPPPQACSAP